MTMRSVSFCLFLAVAFSTEKKLENISVRSRILNVFPAQSSVKIFREFGTDEIYWEDPNKLVPSYFKKLIHKSLQQKEKTISHSILESISRWHVAAETCMFVKEMLLALSDNVDVEKKFGNYSETVLMLATKFNESKAVSRLIRRKANIEQKNRFGEAALYLAAYYGSTSCCKILLKSGANIDAQNDYGSTALSRAIDNGHDEVVELLIQSGANIKI